MPLTVYRRPGSDVWHWRGTVNKHRVRGSSRTTDKAIAQQLAAEEETRHWKSRLDGPASVLKFADAFVLYQKAGKAMRPFILKVLDHWKDTPVKRITPGAIRQAAITLYPNASGATRNRQVIVPTMAVINHAAEAELCPHLKMKRFPVEKKVKEPASWIWVSAFMRASSPHLAALACFMFLTGARITEALSLTWTDVDLSARQAKLRSGKTNSERVAHLPQDLVIAIANIERKGERVFRYSSRDTAKPPWRNAYKRAGIKPLSFHACRHGFATAALRAGIDVVTVAKLGGWKSPAHVFATYGHASDDPTLTDRLVNRPIPDTGIVEKLRSQA